MSAACNCFAPPSLICLPTVLQPTTATFHRSTCCPSCPFKCSTPPALLLTQPALGHVARRTHLKLLCATYWYRLFRCNARTMVTRLLQRFCPGVQSGSPQPGSCSQEAASGGLAASHPQQVPLQQAIQLHGAWLPAAAHPAQPAGGAWAHRDMRAAAVVARAPSDSNIASRCALAAMSCGMGNMAQRLQPLRPRRAVPTLQVTNKWEPNLPWLYMRQQQHTAASLGGE